MNGPLNVADTVGSDAYNCIRTDVLFGAVSFVKEMAKRIPVSAAKKIAIISLPEAL